MQAGFDNDAYDVRVLNHDQAKTQLDNAEIYGIAVIPPNFLVRSCRPTRKAR